MRPVANLEHGGHVARPRTPFPGLAGPPYGHPLRRADRTLGQPYPIHAAHGTDIESDTAVAKGNPSASWRGRQCFCARKRAKAPTSLWLPERRGRIAPRVPERSGPSQRMPGGAHGRGRAKGTVRPRTALGGEPTAGRSWPGVWRPVRTARMGIDVGDVAFPRPAPAHEYRGDRPPRRPYTAACPLAGARPLERRTARWTGRTVDAA